MLQLQHIVGVPCVMVVTGTSSAAHKAECSVLQRKAPEVLKRKIGRYEQRVSDSARVNPQLGQSVGYGDWRYCVKAVPPFLLALSGFGDFCSEVFFFLLDTFTDFQAHIACDLDAGFLGGLGDRQVGINHERLVQKR